MKGGVDTDMLVEFAKSQDSVEVSRIGKQKVYSSNRGRHSMAFATLERMIVGGPGVDSFPKAYSWQKAKLLPTEVTIFLPFLPSKSTTPEFCSSQMSRERPRTTKLTQERCRCLRALAGGMAIGDDGGSVLLQSWRPRMRKPASRSRQ